MSSFTCRSSELEDEELPVRRVQSCRERATPAKTFTLLTLPTGGILPACIPPHNPRQERCCSRHERRHSAPSSTRQIDIRTVRLPESRSRSRPRSCQPSPVQEYISPYSQQAMGVYSGAPRVATHSRGNSLFDDMVEHELTTTLPPLEVRPLIDDRRSLASLTRGSNLAKNMYNERAQQGYRYWHEDKPKNSISSRYAFGAKGSVVGLGKISSF